MTLIGCFVTPHPPIVVPEVGGAQLAEAQATVDAMRLVRDRAAALDPDTIVLLSPHAPMAARYMGVSLASSYEGSLAYFRAPGVVVRAAGDEALAEAIMGSAKKHGLPVAATASPDEMVDLDHGSMVPLVYLLGGLRRPCRLVLLSFSGLSIPDHTRFGNAVGEALLQASQRIVYVASADLSHRLCPGAPVGFDPHGVMFDRLVADTFAAGDWDGLLSIDPRTTAAAGECGYRSLAVLSGVVGAVRAAGSQTHNRRFSYEGPFGVGYLVGEVEIVEASQMAGAAR
jgi:aromatic ring-opening dioxygenase LigB subunit